jgi:pyrroline-5-carboxylate reductase
MVTSPAGATIEAVLAFEQSGFRASVLDAVIAAYEKTKVLGDQK